MSDTPWPTVNLLNYILEDPARAKTAAKVGFVIGGSIIAVSFIIYTSV